MDEIVLQKEALNARFASLITNLQEGVLVENEKRQILLINQKFCDMFHIPASPDSMIGVDCSQSAEESKLYFKDPVEFVSRINLILKEKKIVLADELETIHGVHFERDYVPVFLDEKYLGHLWKYRDVTEKKRLYQELEKANKMKDRIFSILAHDLKSPLATTKGMLELMREDEFSESEKVEIIKGLEEHIDNSLVLLNNLLVWASSTLKNSNPPKKDFLFLEIIQEIETLLFHYISGKSIDFKVDIPKDLKIFSNKDSLMIVVRNLISNAIKYTPREGTIEIFHKINDKEIEIHIKDSGSGIEDDSLKKLFHEAQSSKLGTENEKGSGLGLVLCQSLMKNLDGRLDVISQRGIGSDFIIKIPHFSSPGSGLSNDSKY
ncbi:MAG: ATP-binding protein [Leptospiraceae bacterium]|nr:ATP-binding protein [Leptospiraceae bacterium]MCP5510546.1 ATP-binding protein [Leptospiraceae bacterium]